jgi:hypothetical protein
MPEVPKRLAPSRDTLRELYLKSGNRCAFPGCSRLLFNEKGIFVGQVCHIEAAEPGGERFNASQTNEERRQPSNLMLMCYDHHVETNDEAVFTVPRLRQMKVDHERIFSDVVGAIQKTVADLTELAAPVPPTNLRRMNKIVGWGLSDPELSENLQELLPVLERFFKLPLSTRQFFRVLVSRGHRARWGVDLEASVHDVMQATTVSDEDTRGFFSALDRCGLLTDVEPDDFGTEQVGIKELNSGWTFWSELRTFCETTGLSLALMTDSLDFSHLDQDDPVEAPPSDSRIARH